jgi:hypothetical protein
MNDEKLIEFLSKSPLKTFSAMLDALRYLDGAWIWEELEYELFDDALGDNQQQRVKIRVPRIRGVAANTLFAFTRHAATFHIIRRRPRKMVDQSGQPEEVIVFYELMPAGKYMIKVLEAILAAGESSQAQRAG